MNQHTSLLSDQLPQESRLNKNQPIFKWRNNTMHRFSSKLYTYTPKMSQNNKKRSFQEQTLLDQAQNVPNLHNIPDQYQESIQILKKQVINQDDCQLKDDFKKQTSEEHKSSQMINLKLETDFKQIQPSKEVKQQQEPDKKFSLKAKSQSSSWTTENKKKNTKSNKKSIKKPTKQTIKKSTKQTKKVKAKQSKDKKNKPSNISKRKASNKRRI